MEEFIADLARYDEVPIFGYFREILIKRSPIC